MHALLQHRAESGAACSTSYAARAPSVSVRPRLAPTSAASARRGARTAAATASGSGENSSNSTEALAAMAAEAVASASASRASAAIASRSRSGGSKAAAAAAPKQQRQRSNDDPAATAPDPEAARRMLLLQSAIDKTYRAKLRAFAREATPQSLAALRASLPREQRAQLQAVLDDVGALRREAAREAAREGGFPGAATTGIQEKDDPHAKLDALTRDEEDVLHEELGVRMVGAEKGDSGAASSPSSSSSAAATTTTTTKPRMPASFAEYVAALLPPQQAREIAESLGRDVESGLEGAVASAHKQGPDGGAKAELLVERALRALEPSVLAELCALYDDVRDFEAKLESQQALVAVASAQQQQQEQQQADATPRRAPAAVDVGEAAKQYLALVRRMEAMSARLEERVGGGGGAEAVAADAVVPPPSPRQQRQKQQQEQQEQKEQQPRQPWGASFAQPRRQRSSGSSGGGGATAAAATATVADEAPSTQKQPRASSRKRAATVAESGGDPGSAAR